MRPRLKFTTKILLLGISLIVLTAAALTTVNAFQFREGLYEREFTSAFTVYLAGLNYLTAHYKANRERFVRSSLDFVFDKKFMRIEGAPEQYTAHLPREIRVYDGDGRLIYAFSPGQRATNAPAVLEAGRRDGGYHRDYLRERAQLRITGPLARDGSLPGFIDMIFPTTIPQEMRAFYAQSLAVFGGVSLGAILLSLVFARRVLRPIEILTRAAQRIHEGDLDQRVQIGTTDEIGLLGETFNQMISSLVRRIALMHRMQEWTVRISKQFDPGALYENLAEMFEKMTHAGSVALYEPPAGAGFRAASARGAMDPARSAELARMAHEKGCTLYRNTSGGIGETAESPLELAVPLTVGGKRLGAVYLGPREDGLIYPDETLTIVQTLAQHAAMAIENALLYQEIAQRERVQQEMRWAREIQETLLPRRMPEIAGYELAGLSLPALEVGGDYYDVVQTDGIWHCIVGDVSGKGVPAALIMSIVRSLIHTYSEMTVDPAAILARVNRKLSPDLESQMFVTVASATIHGQGGRICILRAGHEPLLWIRAGAEAEWLQPPGTALGLTDADTFEYLLQPQEVSLAPGEVVIMFTDGVTESRNALQEELGYDRIKSWATEFSSLSASAIAESLVSRVKEFSNGAPQLDDITLLIIKRRG